MRILFQKSPTAKPINALIPPARDDILVPKSEGILSAPAKNPPKFSMKLDKFVAISGREEVAILTSSASPTNTTPSIPTTTANAAAPIIACPAIGPMAANIAVTPDIANKSIDNPAHVSRDGATLNFPISPRIAANSPTTIPNVAIAPRAFRDTPFTSDNIVNAADIDISNIDIPCAATIALSILGACTKAAIIAERTAVTRSIVAMSFQVLFARLLTPTSIANIPIRPITHKVALANLVGSSNVSNAIIPTSAPMHAAITMMSFDASRAFEEALRISTNKPKKPAMIAAPLHTSSSLSKLNTVIAAENIRIAAPILRNIAPALSAYSPAKPENIVTAPNITTMLHITLVALSMVSCLIEPSTLTAVAMRIIEAESFKNILLGSFILGMNEVRTPMPPINKINNARISSIVCMPFSISELVIPAIIFMTIIINPMASAIFMSMFPARLACFPATADTAIIAVNSSPIEPMNASPFPISPHSI